jgi:hypothetical protein
MWANAFARSTFAEAVVTRPHSHRDEGSHRCRPS